MLRLRRVRVVAAGLALTVVACNGSGVGTPDGSAGTAGTGDGGRGGTDGRRRNDGRRRDDGRRRNDGRRRDDGRRRNDGLGWRWWARRFGRRRARRIGGSGGAGRGGSGGAGGTVASTCPSAPPQAGGACTGQGCFYEDCAGVGRTAARCTNGAWVVDRAPCATATCPGIGGSVTCPAGQICSQQAGGAVQPAECVPNGCGTGPVSCDCLRPCAGTCTVTGSVATGFFAFCNTCPQLACP